MRPTTIPESLHEYLMQRPIDSQGQSPRRQHLVLLNVGPANAMRSDQRYQFIRKGGVDLG